MDRDIEIGGKERDRSKEPTLDRSRADDRERRIHDIARDGRRVYSVSPDERQTMVDIGRFRIVDTEDLAGFRYLGKEGQMCQDLKALTAQGLIQTKTVWTGRDREVMTYAALTKAGKRLLIRQQTVPTGQEIYSGFVKPAELRHDAGIYPMFRREASRIEQEGGRIKRVVLDYELKKKAYSPLAKARTLSREEYIKRHAEIAREHGLKIVNGHITLPDLRIEYEDSRGVSGQIDLEVASESYHGSHAAEKAAAGFKIYASPDTAERLSRALEEREITAEIFSL